MHRPVFRFVECTVCLADEQAAVAAEKLPVAVIKRDRKVAAEVFVRHDVSLEIGDERIHPHAVALKGKALGCPLR